MIPAQGLYGHIRNNNVKSAVLLAGFLVLLAVFWFSLCLVWTTLTWSPSRMPDDATLEQRLWLYAVQAGHRTVSTWYLPTLAGLAWLAIAYTFHAHMIRAAMGTKQVTRRDHPKLYNMVEELAIGAGLPMPRIEVMNTGALNAYAAGLSPETATIAVTRGLLQSLSPAELQAVLAHEMTHIKNRDVRLMVVALVFAGGLTFLGQMSIRMFRCSSNTGWQVGDIADVGSALPGIDDIELEGPTAVAGLVVTFVSIVLAVVLLATVHLFALLSQFAISRSREYLADAGAVELTKDPDALISALLKISGHDVVPRVPASLGAMMISNPFEGLFSTHPPIAARVEQLRVMAGGRLPEPAAPRRWGRRQGAVTSSEPAISVQPSASFLDGVAQSDFGRRRLRVSRRVA